MSKINMLPGDKVQQLQDGGNDNVVWLKGIAM